MRRIRTKLIAAALCACPTMFSATTLTENFANYMPASFTVQGSNALQPWIYRNVPEAGTWFVDRLDNGYGRCALAPTRNADGTPSRLAMTLPAISIEPGAILRWEARSLHRHITESYRVDVRTQGSDQWQTVYNCQGESHWWAMHSVKLDDFAGSELSIRFVATTERGFMLAVDNIFVGVPTEPLLKFTDATRRFTGINDDSAVRGTLENHGAATDYDRLTMLDVKGNVVAAIDAPTLSPGEKADLEFPFTPKLGETIDYRLVANSADAELEFASGWVSTSYFARTAVVDRMSGTWCNNCPIMELTTSRLQRFYGDDLVILESHVNDELADATYWTSWMQDFVYSIPMLVPNHDTERKVYSLNATDDFSAALIGTTTFAISAKAMYNPAQTEISIDTEVTAAIGIDNSADRYRVGYMLLGDFHNPMNGSYLQELSATNYRSEQFYYMNEKIVPEMMYFDNVPVETTTAVNGIPASLPKNISTGEPCNHSWSMAVPADINLTAIRLLALIIDTATGTISNAALVEIEDFSGIESATTNSAASAESYYDILGRRLHQPCRGITIERRRDGTSRKIINHNNI